MLHFGTGAALLALATLGCGSAIAAGPPGPLKDWPCAAPFADQLSPEAVWPTALPTSLPAPGAWQADLRAKAIVEFIADTANSPRAGTQYIDDFAVAKGRLSPDLAMLVLSGLVERVNRIRDFLIEGIHTNVVRSHILAGAVAENEAHLAQAAQQDGPDAAAIRKARFANLRALDDAGDGAELLCHRYSYDETKVKTLAAALARQTE
jgi:hypothetical protein